jgi:DNA polymerase-3 subunit delta'
MAAGRLPASLLLVGAPGVGKQRLGLWIAQALVCENGPGEPCGKCQGCRMSLSLSHPDVHWFFPIPRPRGEESRQVEEAEDALATAIAARREQPVYSRPDGMCGLFLPLVRALHRRAQMRPAMARRKVFLVAEAERLVPQASSPDAANAMLKVLEEPPPDTYFVLTAAEPAGLLPTIRSRLVQLRLKRLPPQVVARFLEEVPDPPVPAAEARRRAEFSGGSIGAALALSREADESRAAARKLLDAAAKGRRAGYGYALGVRPYAARGEFTDTLDAAAELLRDELEGLLRSRERSADGARAAGLTRAIREVEEARRLAQANVNPQLVVLDLMRRLAEARR